SGGGAELERGFARPRRDVPDPYRAVAAAGGEAPGVGAEPHGDHGQGDEGLRVAVVEQREAGAGGRGPELRPPVQAPRGDPGAVAAVGDVEDTGFEAGARPGGGFPGGGVPDPDGLAQAPLGDPGAVGAVNDPEGEPGRGLDGQQGAIGAPVPVEPFEAPG